MSSAPLFNFIDVYSTRNRQSLARLQVPTGLLVPPSQQGSDMNYGVFLGPLPTLAHGLKGDVYLMDERRFRVRNFYYDGTAPAAYFWVGRNGVSGPTPDTSGTAVPERSESTRLTRAYNGEEVFVSLPNSFTVRDILWLSVWCIDFRMNFGHVLIPADVQVPSAAVIGQFSGPGISSGNVTIVDVKTIVIDSFSCNCQQQDVEFAGGYDSPMNNLVAFPQRNGQSVNLDEARSVPVQVSIPEPLNIYDFQTVSVYSASSNSSLADIVVSPSLLVPPFIAATITDSGSSSGSTESSSSKHVVIISILLLTSFTLTYTGRHYCSET